MFTSTGAYISEQRRANRLTRAQLAAAIGYTNIAKGADRIVRLERDGHAADGLLEKIVQALGLDRQHVQELINEDRCRFEDAWERWASEPVEPQLRVRVIPAVWCGERLPENLSREEAVAFARTRAMDRKLTYLLVWSRKEEVWCYPEGITRVRTMAVGDVAGPFTRLRGHGDRHGFVFG
jgi:hypothetical protein